MDFREALSALARQVAGLLPSPEDSTDSLTKLLTADQIALARELVDRHAKAVEEIAYRRTSDKEKSRDHIVEEVLGADASIQRATAFVAIESLLARRGWRDAHSQLLSKILRRDLEFDERQLRWLVHHSTIAHEKYWKVPWDEIMRQVIHHTKKSRPGEDFLLVLGQSRQHLQSFSKMEKILLQLDAIITGEAAALVVIVPGEAWSDLALTDLQAAESTQRAAWNVLLSHAATAETSKPSSAWLKTARDLCDRIGAPSFVQHFDRWLGAVGRPARHPARPNHYLDAATISTLLGENNATLLKGLAWASATVDHPAVPGILGRCAEVCYKKVPNFGQRCAKLGNACVQTLAIIGTPASVSQIVRVKTRSKYPSVQSLINNALLAAAEKTGVSIEELEEIAVPSYGLGEDGTRSEPLGGFVGQIRILRSDDVELRWLRPDGRPQASVPKSVKEQHADDLKELKQIAVELRKMLPAHKDRIERLYLQRRAWPYFKWREHYLDHPLIGQLARRLIWSFEVNRQNIAGVWWQGDLVGATEMPLAGIGGDTIVSMWHPINETAEAVLQWRTWLTEHKVTQPFKQAHREIYLLTDAERETHTYSNRFAAHVLKQHPFVALCRQRGWIFHLMGGWDSHNRPTKILPAWDLRCEYWVGDGGDASELSDSGAYLYLPTDQVRFYPVATADPLGLDEVPPMVFSEIMRDVDLFVGVASVGNDPNWHDGGAERYNTYWHAYSFGALSATAETRRDVLAQILPKLKIASRCRIERRYLVVEGHLKTYKIHLGSGNILMAPNDQYLCVVPSSLGSVAKGKLFLPFEGDSTLSVVLSKAFMLADDHTIQDPSILSQIRRS